MTEQCFAKILILLATLIYFTLLTFYLFLVLLDINSLFDSNKVGEYT